jgi:hypothetical protein
VLSSHFGFLFLVCAFGIFEDVEEMFAGADYFPRFIDDRDGFHDRHFDGMVLL